jgi:hypothetical protein
MQNIAVITTDGPTPSSLGLPLTMAKIEEVAAGTGHFSIEDDRLIARWILKLSTIMTMR